MLRKKIPKRLPLVSLHSYMKLIFCLPMVIVLACQSEQALVEGDYENGQYQTWEHYLGDPGRTHYSQLDQINRSNVDKLSVAWTYHSGDVDPEGYIQCSPIVVENVLYATSPRLKVFALNAATGKELWKYDPFASTDQKGFSRGVSYWNNGDDQRILFAAGHHLYALDAKTGKPVSSFGTEGKIDLTTGLDRDITGLAYKSITPGAIYQDLIILGALTSEAHPSAPGHIRAFDARTGKQVWIFHTIPMPGEEGYDTWEDSTAYQHIGGANSWAGITLDEKRGVVYVPVGSAAADFYGGNRKGTNLYANCLLALDAATGKKRWHFQTVHHDLWDRDLPAPPTLVTVNHNGKNIEAVAQVTKSGFVYLFNRDTGEPLFPVEEKPYPASDLIGEQTHPTQPLPLKPPPFARQQFTEADINPDSRQKDSLIAVLKNFRSGGQFIPPSMEGTVIFPGFDGGAEWGGAGYDPASGMLYVNANEMPWILTMIEIQANPGGNLLAQGKTVYESNCMGCHGADLQGSTFHGTAPALVDLGQRAGAEKVFDMVRNGKGAMPSFAFLTNHQIEAVASYLLDKKGRESMRQVRRTASADKNISTDQLRYGHTGYNRYVDSDGYPAVKPPWGTLNAIDLNKGEIAWQVPLGEYPELTEKGIPLTGTENYGGPIVTAGGLIFIAATKDPNIRAFDKDSGKELWKYQLPAAGMATPCTYEVDGVQYVVVAAGGGKNVKQRGDAYVAFALPQAP